MHPSCQTLAVMNEAERWAYLESLDQELLLTCVVLSEWCSFIFRESDIAYAHSANLAAILTAVSGAETFLRSKFADSKRERLTELIDKALIRRDIKADLHTLRRYRNRWVHVESPWTDEALLDSPGPVEQELEDMATFAVRVLRRLIYEDQWV